MRSEPRYLRLTHKERACACRKPKSGHIGDAARQPGHATRCVRSAEPGVRPAHPGPMTGDSRGIVITSVLSQDTTQMRLAQHDDVVHTLAMDRSNQPLGKRILPRRAR
jgi:hypothetical protein